MALFLASPIPPELGMVQFRVLGDHAEDPWLVFDYDEANLANSLVSCVPVREQWFQRQNVTSVGRQYVLQGSDGTCMGNVKCIEAQADEVFEVNTRGGGGQITIAKRQWYQRRSLLRSVLGDGPKRYTVQMRHSTPLSKSPESEDSISEYTNQTPQWNANLKTFMLNFQGRVTMSSSKNLLLCCDTHTTVQSFVEDSGPCNLSMRFGRVAAKSTQTGSPQFVMDVGYPLSPLQAMGVALSSIISKN